MLTASFLTALVLSLVVAANPVLKNPPITLPFTKRVNATNMLNIVKFDQARAKSLVARGHVNNNARLEVALAPVNEQVDNQATSYVVTIGIGTPPTDYQLIVDTGSSNTWVGASQPYAPTSSSQQTANGVAVTYGSGSFSGTEFLDSVTIASGLVISNQSIGVASTSTGFVGVDGIIGIGPVDLTLGTLNPATSSPIPTVTDNAFSQSQIPVDLLGISFQPTNQPDNVNGEITWGGTDSANFNGDITYTPVTITAPASSFWGIDQSIRYGASTTILKATAGIIDTGTTLVLIASDAFAAYTQITGASLDTQRTGLLTLTASQFNNLQSLFFTINGTPFELTRDAQLWPRALNAAIGGSAGDIYLIVGNLGTPSGEGFDFVNGMTFLERFYSVFDTTNKRVGFATTGFTNVIVNN